MMSVWIGIFPVLFSLWVIFAFLLVFIYKWAKNKEIVPEDTKDRRSRDKHSYEIWMIPEHEIPFERWIHEADAYKEYVRSKSTLDYDHWLGIQLKRRKDFKSKYFI